MDHEISPNPQIEEVLRLVASGATPACCMSCGTVEYILPLDDQPLDAVLLANYYCAECDDDRDLRTGSAW